MDTRTADCGKRFDHQPHAYRTESGKVKACDGSVDKRNPGAAAFVKVGEK